MRVLLLNSELDDNGNIVAAVTEIKQIFDQECIDPESVNVGTRMAIYKSNVEGGTTDGFTYSSTKGSLYGIH